MLDEGADVNAVDDYQSTALHYAAVAPNDAKEEIKYVDTDSKNENKKAEQWKKRQSVM